jgi:hypothetical protein
MQGTVQMLTRRGLLKGATVAGVTAGAALKGLLPIGSDVIAAPVMVDAWKLSPRYPCRRLGRGQEAGVRPRVPKCLACNACRSHARHKWFATVRAARRNRAHVACNCVAFKVKVTRRRFRRMFGFPGCAGQGRKVFDTRTDTLYTRCAVP